MNDNTRARRTEDQLVHRISSFLPKVDLAFQWLGGVGKMSITTMCTLLGCDTLIFDSCNNLSIHTRTACVCLN